MSKQVLRKVAELAMADFLASGRVVTKCAPGRRSGGLAATRAARMPMWQVMSLLQR